MKKGFTLFEVGAVLSIVAAVAMVSDSYRGQLIESEQSKSLAKDLYSYNSLVGQKLRGSSIQEARGLVGTHDGVSWLAVPNKTMPNGRTHNFSLKPTTEVFETAEGYFTTRTIWSPIVVGGELHESLMGRAALHASSMILTDKSETRSDQGLTIYCPSSSVTEGRNKEACNGASGSIVSLNYANIKEQKDYNVEALSINHENTMEAPIVFDASGEDSSGDSLGNLNIVPFEELGDAEFGGSDFYSETIDTYHIDHSRYELYDEYQVGVWNEVDYDINYNYNRSGDSIEITSSGFDGVVHYNRSTRVLTHESSTYCDNNLPEDPVFPFTEADDSEFTLTYQDGWGYEEYYYQDPDGGEHYRYEPYGEYSYYNASGDSYYSDGYTATYTDDTYEYQKDLSTGEVTVSSVEICSKEYIDTDLIYDYSYLDSAFEGSSAPSEARSIKNVARIYNKNDESLKIGKGGAVVGLYGSTFLANFDDADDGIYGFKRGHSNTGLWWNAFVPPTGMGRWTAASVADGRPIDVLFRENSAGVNGDVNVAGIITSRTARLEKLNANYMAIRDFKSRSYSDINANQLGVSGAQDSSWTTPGITADFVRTEHDSNGFSSNSNLSIGNGHLLIEEHASNTDEYDNEWQSRRIRIKGDMVTDSLDLSLNAEAAYSVDPDSGMPINGSVDMVQMPYLKASGESASVAPAEFSMMYDFDQSSYAWEGFYSSYENDSDDFYACYGKIGKYANGDTALCGEGVKYHKATPGASLWEKYAPPMFSYEKDIMYRFTTRADAFCESNYGSGYKYAYLGGSEFSYYVSRKTVPVKDTNGDIVGYRYFVKTIPSRDDYSVCFKSIN